MAEGDVGTPMAPPADQCGTQRSCRLKEEVLAREARALQLNVGDTVIRRLARKMAILLDDTIRTA